MSRTITNEKLKKLWLKEIFSDEYLLGSKKLPDTYLEWMANYLTEHGLRLAEEN